MGDADRSAQMHVRGNGVSKTEAICSAHRLGAPFGVLSPASGVCRSDLAVEHGFKTLAVEKPGQVISDCLAMVAVLGGLELGHIGHDRQGEAIVSARAGFRFHDKDVHSAAVQADELDGNRHAALGPAALDELVAGVCRDEIGEVAADDGGAIIAGGKQPIIADGGNAVFLVEGEEHGGGEIVNIGGAAMGELQLLLLVFELGLHLVEAAGEPSHLVVRLPVDVMAGAELAGGLDRCRQPHQRLDDEEAVADQRGAENGQNCEDEDRNEDDLFLLQTRKTGR